MGSPASEEGRNDEGPVHRVCVDGFAMGKYEVTQGQWQRIMGNNPASYQNGDNYPVEQVSWSDVQEFVAKLNRQSGMDYRLPTEAEWEYAARAGTTSARFWGEKPDEACGYDNVHDLTSKRVNRFSWANYNCDDGFAQTSPVGSFKPNSFGLYDMLGNVWEWTGDWYSDKYYGKSPSQNPGGPGSGSSRVTRGGNWYAMTADVRFAFRLRDAPAGRDHGLGFRLVLPPGQ